VILIVDDNREGRDALKRLLVRVGYRAESVGVGTEALDYLRAVRPKLVILDVTDALGTGMGVLREIRKDPEMLGVPVVVRTAGEESKAEMEARKLGVSGCLAEGEGDFIGLLSRIAQVCESMLPIAPGMTVALG
jgi:two-component system chemotaxis response regulator CheY